MAFFCFSANGQQAAKANPLPDAPNPLHAPRPNPVDGVYHAGDGITPPVLVYSVEPKVSEVARKTKGKRACTVYFIVGTDGHTSAIHVTTSKDKLIKQFDPRTCETEAIDSVKEFRFKPATLQGKPVPFETTIDLNYEVN
jgi:hypothetical protein